MRLRLRLCLHHLFVLFAGFLISLSSLATQTEALLTKSVRRADSSSVTTTTTEESGLRSGGETGLNAVCRGQAKAFHVPLIGIPKPNYGIFAEVGRSLAAKGGTLTFYRGTTYYDALETVQNGAFDAARLAQRQASASYSPGLYLTSQEATANYYADLAGGGLRGRGGGPAVLRITVPQDQFGALMQKYGIQLEIPVGRPPFPGQTETLIPPSAIDEFNAIMNVSHH